MIVRFDETFKLPLEDLTALFKTPADWVQVFGFPGETKDLGDGWYSVSLKHFPFPLKARNIEEKDGQLVRWVFRGFWHGYGEVRFSETEAGVNVKVIEEVAVHYLFFLSPLFERLILKRNFRRIWEVGWYRLHKREASNGAGRIYE